ncbi:MAG: prepilin peptidase [Candidatus Kaiserbacteria bacterium]|nr:prepilin peptidase [Candidatus Kaiserbacteria bacterium]
MITLVATLSPLSAVVLAAFLFILGTVFGSYMDVVRSRQSWRHSLTGRSQCLSCSKTLSWQQLIPVFSYLTSQGRCAFCSEQIPRAHLFAEIATGILFALAVFGTASPWVMGAVLLSAIFVIPIITADIEAMEVPEHLSVPFSFITLGFAAILSLHIGSGAPILSGLVFAAPFALLWWGSGGRAMGLGDAKVAISLGFLLADPILAISAFFLSFWIGTLGIAAVALQRVLRGQPHGISRGLHVPFVPSIAIAFFFTLVTDFSLFSGLSGIL